MRGMKVLAAALLVVGFGAVFTARWMAFQSWGGLWWLAGLGIAAACIVGAPVLWRLGDRRSARRSAE